MTKIIAIDLGYGAVKVVSGTEFKIDTIFKFPSVVGVVEKNEMVTDERLIDYEDRSFYVGEDALHLPTDSIIDVADYSKLEYFAPVFIYKTFAMLETVPEYLVLGLSIAQIKNSGYYKERISKYLDSLGIKCQIYILPQGAIAKLAIDKYGVDFPNENISFNKNASYIGADCGFNTLDIWHVINGQTSANLVVGLEQKGAIVMALQLIDLINETYGIKLNISEVKEVLTTGSFVRRKKTYSCDQLVSKVKLAYQEMLTDIIEERFGKVLDKVDNLVLIGGGSTFLDPDPNGFMIKPKDKPEYYNAIGYYEYAVKQLEK